MSTKKIAQDVKDGKLDIKDIDENYFGSTLMSANLPDVDLMVRTSGEQRLSNFMLCNLLMQSLFLLLFVGQILMKKNYIKQFGFIKIGSVDMEV